MSSLRGAQLLAGGTLRTAALFWGLIGQSSYNTVNCGSEQSTTHLLVGAMCEILRTIDVENSGLWASHAILFAVALQQHVTHFQETDLSNWPQLGFGYGDGLIHSSPHWSVSGTLFLLMR